MIASHESIVLKKLVDSTPIPTILVYKPSDIITVLSSSAFSSHPTKQAKWNWTNSLLTIGQQVACATPLTREPPLMRVHVTLRPYGGGGGENRGGGGVHENPIWCYYKVHSVCGKWAINFEVWASFWLHLEPLETIVVREVAERCSPDEDRC